MVKCSLCSWEFNEQEEGINGAVGILPVKLCQTCYHGMIDMVEKMGANAHVECPECGHGIQLKVEVVT